MYYLTYNLIQFFFLLLFVFSFHSQHFYHYDPSHQFLLHSYSHESINQSCNLKHYIVFVCFFLQINLLSFVSTDSSFVKMTSYCLNPNLILKVCANFVPQSIITLVINFLPQKSSVRLFLGLSTSSYLYFLWSKRYLTVICLKFL